MHYILAHSMQKGTFIVIYCIHKGPF